MPHKKKSGRAANGSGSIRKRTVTRNGRSYTCWEARVTVGMDPITGKQVQRTITGKTQQEVAQRAREIAVELDHKTYKAPLQADRGGMAGTLEAGVHGGCEAIDCLPVWPQH